MEGKMSNSQAVRVLSIGMVLVHVGLFIILKLILFTSFMIQDIKGGLI
jgi:hypothetical protein